MCGTFRRVTLNPFLGTTVAGFATNAITQLKLGAAFVLSYVVRVAIKTNFCGGGTAQSEITRDAFRILAC